MVTWTRGRHLVKFGIGIPHMSRRAYDDNTNALGTYTFGPTLAADGVTVLETALPELRRQPALRILCRTPATPTSSITSRRWARSFRTSSKINNRFSITPGLRYDWQNFLATRRLGFSPRVSFAWVLDRGLEDRRARRRRHLLRPLRLRSAARPGPL